MTHNPKFPILLSPKNDSCLDLDEAGIDVQILSHTCPGVAELPASESIEWAKKINDIFAEICVECSLSPSDAKKVISYHVAAIMRAYEYTGIDHLLLGTDYPHRASGTVLGNFEILDSMGFSDEEKEKISSRNAVKLFNLE